MTSAATRSVELSFSPLHLQGRSTAWRVGAMVAGILLLTLASYIKIPMVPVPITMQTFAVGLVGALFGWRLGAMTVIAWLALGALGLPVLAGGAAGVQRFLGATAGYLFAFPVAAALVGWLAQRGWNGHRILLAFAAMLLGNAVCLGIGATWLAFMIGPERAIIHGVAPFLVGAVLKSALAALTLKVLSRRKTR